MRFVTARRGAGLSWVSILGVVCIALVLLTGIVQVTHTHANGQIDHDCSLCVTAHHAVHIAVIVALVISSRPIAHVTDYRFSPAPRQRFILKRANRPPPVPSVLG
jgi:hypothetical protein